MKKALWVTLLSVLVLSVPVSAASLEQATAVQKAYAPILLKMSGVTAVATADCGDHSCVVVVVPDAGDRAGIIEIFGNPLVIDGVEFYFVDREPLPDKGGVTVHN